MSTSDYSKLFEGFLKDRGMEDIVDNIDVGQFGEQSGMGTEHILVCFIDRIRKLHTRTNLRSLLLYWIGQQHLTARI